MNAPTQTADTTIAPPLWLLVLFTCIGPLAINLYQPSLPSVAADFSVSYADAQRTMTVYILGIALGQLIYGPLSDRFGRQPLALIGGLIFLVSNALVALAPNLEAMLAGRVLQAIGGCSGIVLTRAIVRDCYPEARAASALGTITMTMLIVPALAPLLGGVLDKAVGWRAGFWLLAVLGALQAWLAWRVLRETNRAPLASVSFASVTSGFGALLGNREFALLVMGASLSMASYFVFLAAAPYAVIDVFGATPVDYGLYNLILAAGYFVGNFMAGRYTVRWGVPKALRIGVTLFSLGALALPLAWAVLTPSPVLLFAALVPSIIGSGLLFPVLTAAALSINPRLAGSASALIGLLPMLFSALATELTGPLLAPDLWAFLLSYTGLCLLSGVLLMGALVLRGRRA